MTILYGRDWGNSSQLQIELSAYRHGLTPAQGGLGKLEHFKNAYSILFPKLIPSYFSWTEEMFKAYAEESRIGGGIVSVLGGSGCGKSFSTGLWAFTDFMAAPDDTITLCASTTLEDLNQRIWKYIKETHEDLPFEFGRYQRARPACLISGKGGIYAKALDGDPEAEGIKGFHPRRLRIIIDEGTAIPKTILNAYENWISAGKEFLLIVLSNFRGLDNLCAEVSEPIGGWNSIDYENTSKWVTKKGGKCLLFDLTKSPVYKNPKLSEPGSPLSFIRTKADIDKAIYGEGKMGGLGLTHPRVMQYIRSIPLFDDSVKTILNQKLIINADIHRVPKWAGFGQTKLAALDPAFVTDGDSCVLAFGTLGWEQSGKQILWNEDIVPIPIDSRAKLTTEYQILEFTVNECLKRGIPPENFIMDSCGTGRGLGSIFEHEWSDKINKIMPSQACSEEIVDFEFNKTAKEIYDRFVTQLWFQYRNYVESGQILNIHPEAIKQFCTRLYDDSRVKIVLVKKPDYKKRIYGDDEVKGSPDEADVSTYLHHLAVLKGMEHSRLRDTYSDQVATSQRDKFEAAVMEWHENKYKEKEVDASEALGYDWVGDIIGGSDL
jgi:hypothetical protein